MASERVAVYSADQVTISLGGVPIDSGLGDGTFITIEVAVDDFSHKVGADGEVARAKSNNRSATAKLSLLHTSLSNNYLSTLRAADLLSPNGSGVGAFQVVDNSSGVTVCHAPKAWIQKPPAAKRSREIDVNEWTIAIASADFDFSGSPSV